MVKPAEKLASSLDELRKLQERGLIAIRSKDLSRTHRQRLAKNGFLKKIVKGWYISASPDETQGESTTWYVSYWRFCSAYLNRLKKDDWCLSPEQSVSLHADNWTVPGQLLVRAAKARNNITLLPHGTSLLDIRSNLPEPGKIVIKDGMRIYSLPAALVACGERFFRQYPTDARAALAVVADASELLAQLLEGGHATVAGRLAGAFRNIGRFRIADDILQSMRAAGYQVREADPFEFPSLVKFPRRELSPCVGRIRLMWNEMRTEVIDNFPAPPHRKVTTTTYLRQVEDSYVEDAYHSLSIEGYQVSTELIERVRSGGWNPARSVDDRDSLSALAARGYWQAFQSVRGSIEKILEGQNAGETVDFDHGDWYREMFAPGVSAGIHQLADLAGYRNGPVFIRRSRHVPPSKEAVRDAMPALFELLKEETSAKARAVLGHFVFVYIHPYMDGNGRMGRFLMNAMLASGGYPWTIIPLERRNDYMTALEKASVNKEIEPFSKLLGSLVQAGH